MAKAGMIVTAILVAVVGIAAFAVHSYAADDPAMPQAGQMAPTFTLPSQDGTQIALDSFKGKWVVLYFYPKDMTTGCTIEAHNFQRDQEQYTKENAVILGVSVDIDRQPQAVLHQGKPDLPPARRPENKVVVKAYGSLGNFGSSRSPSGTPS